MEVETTSSEQSPPPDMGCPVGDPVCPVLLCLLPDHLPASSSVPCPLRNVTNEVDKISMDIADDKIFDGLETVMSTNYVNDNVSGVVAFTGELSRREMLIQK